MILVVPNNNLIGFFRAQIEKRTNYLLVFRG